MRPRNEALRAEVHRLKQTGISQKAIAGIVGKSQAYISLILRQGQWSPEPASRWLAPTAAQQTERAQRAVAASNAYFDGQETDIRLDLALGDPRDLRAYQDCIESARYEGARARENRP